MGKRCSIEGGATADRGGEAVFEEEAEELGAGGAAATTMTEGGGAGVERGAAEDGATAVWLTSGTGLSRPR